MAPFGSGAGSARSSPERLLDHGPIVAVDGRGGALHAERLQQDAAEVLGRVCELACKRGPQALLHQAQVSRLGDVGGIKLRLCHAEQRFEHLGRYGPARGRLEVEREKRVFVHDVRLDRVDEELVDDAVGQNAELRVHEGVEVASELPAIVHEVGSDLLALDGDDRHAVTQDGEIDLVEGIGAEVGDVLGMDLEGRRVVVAEEAQEGHDEKEFGALLVRAATLDADCAGGKLRQLAPQFGNRARLIHGVT